jgi:hypothetical protein
MLRCVVQVPNWAFESSTGAGGSRRQQQQGAWQQSRIGPGCCGYSVGQQQKLFWFQPE